MLSKVKIQQGEDEEFEEINSDEICNYEGNSEITGIDAVANTTEMSLNYLKDFFPSLSTLILTNSYLASIRDIGASYSHLKVLSLTFCDLTTLDGISQISFRIEELYLSHNKISNISDLIGMNNLLILDLEANDITNIDDIEILTSCDSLEALILRGNPAANVESYRSKVRYLLPNLMYLDDVKYLAHETRGVLPSISPKKEVENDSFSDSNSDEHEKEMQEEISMVKGTKPYTAPPLSGSELEQKEVMLKDIYALKPLTGVAKPVQRSHQTPAIIRPNAGIIKLKKKTILTKLKPL